MRVLLALLAVALAGLAIWLLQPTPSRQRVPQLIAVNAPMASDPAPVIAATGQPRSGLTHARPPEPAVLRDAPARQALYDAEAKPGEFVTAPNVSEPH